MATRSTEVRVPPLESGDILSRAEFERRWAMHPEIKKAERLNGMVFVQLSVNRAHSQPHGRITTWLGAYAARHPEIEMLPESTVRLGDDDVQPDALLRYVNGRSTVGEDDCIHGAPELVVEISASSVSYDLHQKRETYRRNGVGEYLVWQVFEERLEWWELVDGTYLAIPPAPGGIVASRLFPGLNLNRDAMLAGDLATVLAAL